MEGSSEGRLGLLEKVQAGDNREKTEARRAWSCSEALAPYSQNAGRGHEGSGVKEDAQPSEIMGELGRNGDSHEGTLLAESA